jgi:hypothetical protein
VEVRKHMHDRTALYPTHVCFNTRFLFAEGGRSGIVGFLNPFEKDDKCIKLQFSILLHNTVTWEDFKVY